MNHDIASAAQLTTGSSPKSKTGYHLEAVSTPLADSPADVVRTPLLTPSAHSSTLELVAEPDQGQGQRSTGPASCRMPVP
jgi:hypothetical protein